MNPNTLPGREEVVSLLYKHWSPTPAHELISLESACSRVLAADLESKLTLPVFRSAGPDGIAVRYSDFENGMPDTENWKKGTDFCMADTGDDFDDPFDTVIPIEAVTFLDNGGIEFHLEKSLIQGQGVSLQGSRLKEGEPLLAKGTVLTPWHLNLLACGGYKEVPVVSKPKVIYIPTGSELVYPGTSPSRGENVESNGLMLQSFVESWGAQVIRYPICKDIQSELENILDQALLEGDIILINGGSSKGSEDFNTRLIQRRSTYFQHRARSVPGFPVGAGIVDKKPVISLPGPPMATFSVMHWCVKALVYRGLGIPVPMPKTTVAILQEELEAPEKLDFYQRIYLKEGSDGLLALPMKQKREARRMDACNGLFVLPAGSHYQKGDRILVEWL
ncbi:MAG: molybdopterin molybdotransferase MoeA [Muricomes sp.]